MKKIFSFEKYVKSLYGATKNIDILFEVFKEARYWAALCEGKEVIDGMIDELFNIHDDWCEVVEDEENNR